ncbi:hypothetical protein ABIE26_000183 [Pedobacter africanus]|uniref:Uncharacterized protein n=1 Tax=Pedobacter africanus TaxID=151894 RepID=A0ACC6KVZ9_9SPHI|nr:peptidoglycan-binding protein [Pedobacter africanus]MDR6783329.1 hypothetical protein [Pedobacter africanus]
MGTIKIILALFCFAFIGRSIVPERNLLADSSKDLSSLRFLRDDVLRIARAEIGVREASGNNDGKRIEDYLATVGLPKGQPYCAAFISWVFKEAGYALPRTGWSPALFPNSRLVRDIVPANLFGIYFPSLKRIAHCGFIDSRKGDWIATVEANTNPSGDRDGDGVYKRLRHVKTIHSFSDWIRKREGTK